MTFDLILFTFFVLLSFYFSGSEAGFSTLNRQRYYADIQKKNPEALRVKILVENPSRVLILVLLGNNLANVASIYLAERLWEKSSFRDDLIVFLIGSSVFFLVFCEIIPKVIYRNFSNKLVYFSGPLLYFFEWFFIPVSWWLRKLAEWMLLKPFSQAGKAVDQNKDTLSNEDFQHIIINGKDEGLFSSDQILFLSNLSTLSKVRSLELMTPLADLLMLHVDQDTRAVKTAIAKEKVQYIPVYEGRIDNIVGYIDSVDVFSWTKKKKGIRDFLIKPIYVPEIISIDKIYTYFREHQHKILVMVNEYGGCSGIITENHIIENIFGFRYNQLMKNKKQLIEKESEKTYIVDTAVDIDDLNRMLMLGIKKEGFETLGGFINYLFEKLPEKGEIRFFKNVSFTILKVTRSSVEAVRIDLLDKKMRKKNA